MTTEKALAEESESIGLMQGSRGRGQRIMRSWIVQGRLHRGPLTGGQKQAVKLILSATDRVIGVQGYAGTGKTTMLRRARALAQKKGLPMRTGAWSPGGCRRAAKRPMTARAWRFIALRRGIRRPNTG